MRVLDLFRREGAASSDEVKMQTWRDSLYNSMKHVRNIVSLDASFRKITSAGLRKGCYSPLDSLDIWTVVQSMLDSAVVQKYAGKSWLAGDDGCVI